MFKRGDVYFIRVPLSNGGSVKRSTGTSERRTAALIEGLVGDLRARHGWALLDAVTGGEERSIDPVTRRARRTEGAITLEQLYAAHVAGRLEQLKESLRDVDLAAHVDAWQEQLRANLGNDADTVARYLTHVRTLITEGGPFPRSHFTPERLKKWVNGPLGASGKDGKPRTVSSATRRKYHAAMTSFGEHLVSVNALSLNPMRSVPRPAAGKARDKYLDHGQVLELLLKLPEPYRTIEALMHGTGMEISAALRVTRADVDALAMTVRARGTKTEARDRTCAVSEWAWPYVERHLATVAEESDALLFRGLNRWTASDVHREACKGLGGTFAGYRIHDARRSYAVRLVRVGAPMEVAAAQLGHSSTAMVAKVYGRFKPAQDEVRKWERLAAARDAEQEKRRKSNRIAIA